MCQQCEEVVIEAEDVIFELGRALAAAGSRAGGVQGFAEALLLGADACELLLGQAAAALGLGPAVQAWQLAASCCGSCIVAGASVHIAMGPVRQHMWMDT